MSGAKDDLTKDMPNPPQPLKVEEVTKQVTQQDLGPSPDDGEDIINKYNIVMIVRVLGRYWQSCGVEDHTPTTPISTGKDGSRSTSTCSGHTPST